MPGNRCPNCGGEVKDGKCLYCNTVCNQHEVSDKKLHDMIKEVKFHEIDEKSKNEKLMLRNEKIKLIIALIIVAVISAVIILYFIIPRFEKIFLSYTNEMTEAHLNPYQQMMQDTSEAGAMAEERMKEMCEDIQKTREAVAKINKNNALNMKSATEGQETADKADQYKEKGKWPSGTYRIGDDIPKGTYLLVSSGKTPSNEFSVAVYTDAECKDENCISTGTWGQNSKYVTLSGNGYLDFSGCILIDIEKNEVKNSPYEHSGMFLVGKDIQPGTYELEKLKEDTPFYTVYSNVDLITPSARQSLIYEDGCKVTVEEGDYLRLEGCKIKE